MVLSTASAKATDWPPTTPLITTPAAKPAVKPALEPTVYIIDEILNAINSLFSQISRK